MILTELISGKTSIAALLVASTSLIPLVSAETHISPGTVRAAKHRYKVVAPRGTAESVMLVPLGDVHTNVGDVHTNVIDYPLDPPELPGDGTITMEVPVTYSGVTLSGSISYAKVQDYQVGGSKGFAVVGGGCGNVNGYAFQVGEGWSYGTWAQPNGKYSCQYPDEHYCDTLAKSGQTSDRTFYWPNYANPKKPHYVYVTVDFGYNTDSKYWMYATTTNPIVGGGYGYNPVGYQFNYWEKRSSGGGDGYRLGPFLLHEVPIGPGAAGVKTFYERCSNYLFGAPYGQSCLRSVELFEAVPGPVQRQTSSFSINVGLDFGENIVDIPLWGMEGTNIDPDSVDLFTTDPRWVAEQRTVTVQISQEDFNTIYGGNYSNCETAVSMLASYRMGGYGEPTAQPVLQLSDQKIVYKGNFPHLRLKVTQ